MILCFPDFDTFRLVATSTLLSGELVLEAARVHFDQGGRVYLETDGKVTKKNAGELTRLNVTTAKILPEPFEEIIAWMQALDLDRVDAPALSAQAPVLFDLAEASLLAPLVGEMLRLGNDRQGYAAYGDQRLLLRVVGPPYYTVLQSLDPQVTEATRPVAAFTEVAPRVWVQLGFRHPSGERIQVPEDRLLLIRPGRRWTSIENPAFRDIYEVLRFPLTADPTPLQPIAAPEKFDVPLRLIPGNAAETAEFWVLAENGIEALDAFVREADDRLIQRLRFAVSEPQSDGERIIAVRLSSSKLPPPVLNWPEAVAFKPYFKLPNLFVPVGARLHPQLRRDAVRTLLAPDPDRVAWLRPSGSAFVPESMAEESFRPLENWVDYILEANPEPLKAWIAASEFDFEAFVCGDAPAKPRGPDRGAKERPRGKETDGVSPLKPETPASTTSAFPATAAPEKPKDESARRDEWKIERADLQDRFLRLEGGLDEPHRQSLWPALARANCGAGDPAEAAICWVNSLWDRELPAAESVEGWFQTEHADRRTALLPGELDSLLANPNPDRVEVRRFASAVLFLLRPQPVPEWVADRAGPIQLFLETNDSKLPVRAVWLLARELATLAGADVLGLARVRDRILQRLLDSGLNAETDLPFFLRTAGLKDSERVRLVRDQATTLHGLCRTWAVAAPVSLLAIGARDNKQTLPYIDWLFAFALAKLGENTAARNLLERAGPPTEARGTPDPKALTLKHLAEAFRFRVEEALAGKPAAPSLPKEILAGIDHLAAVGKGIANHPHSTAYFAVTRMRQQSTILEPQERADPNAQFLKTGGDDFVRALNRIGDIREPFELARHIRQVYRGGVAGKDPQPLSAVRLRTLHAALPWAFRVGEVFTLELLDLVHDVLRVEPGYEAIADLNRIQGQLLERALFLAGHYDRREVLSRLLDRFVELVGAKPLDQRFELVNFVAGQCLKSLRKLGLRDEIDKLLRRILALVLDGRSVAQVKSRYAARPDQWWRALQTLLALAGGWLTFGNFDEANPILDEARAELLAPHRRTAEPHHKEFPKLAQAYIGAVAQGPSESGITRIAELIRQMDPSRVPVAYTTAPYYSRLHLNIVEEIVLAIVSDEFALGPAGRRWLDEDEYLVRRRIHRDMEEVLRTSRL